MPPVPPPPPDPGSATDFSPGPRFLADQIYRDRSGDFTGQWAVTALEFQRYIIKVQPWQ